MQNHKGFRKENVKVWEAAFLLKSSSEPLGLDPGGWIPREFVFDSFHYLGRVPESIHPHPQTLDMMSYFLIEGGYSSLSISMSNVKAGSA